MFVSFVFHTLCFRIPRVFYSVFLSCLLPGIPVQQNGDQRRRQVQVQLAIEKIKDFSLSLSLSLSL